MSKGLVAESTITISVPVEEVWKALTEPEIIKQYMFGTEVETDWKVGSPIFWRGQWQGKKYEDKGEILQYEENRSVSYSHFSPLTCQPDIPDNYHTITIKLSDDNGHTSATLSQDGNDTEEAQKYSQKNWDMMLQSLRQLLEK